MQITSLPRNYSSLYNELIYTITDSIVRTFDIKVIDTDTNEVVGARRFTGVNQTSIDIAPMLRRRLGFIPQTTPTGFAAPIGRTISAVIEVDGIRSERRTYLPAPRLVMPPELLSTSQGVRLIGRKECDELTICTSTPAQVTLIAIRNGIHTSKNYTAPTAGAILFRLNTADFPQADTIRISIDNVGEVTYNLHDRTAGTRLAWRSSAGSIEHYTFPVIKEQHQEVEKRYLQTHSEVIPTFIRSRTALTLYSDYEPERILEPLAEILTSPAVWRVVNGVYEPIEVTNTASGLRNRGALRRMELQIRHQPKNILP